MIQVCGLQERVQFIFKLDDGFTRPDELDEKISRQRDSDSDQTPVFFRAGIRTDG